MAVKTIFLTTTGAGTWTAPSDWTDVNTIEVLGGGAGGRVAVAGGGGGGAGAYSSDSNVSLGTPTATASIRSLASIGYVSRTNTTIAKPSGAAVGDWLVAKLIRGSTTLQAITPPTGWSTYTATTFTAVADGSPTPFRAQFHLYVRKVDGSEGANFQFSHAAQSTEGVILAIQGADSITTMANLIGTVSQNSSNASTADITVTGISVSDASLVLGDSFDWGETTNARNVPAGTNPTFTENYDVSGVDSLLYVASGSKSGAGTTDNKVFDNRNTAADPIWGALIEIKGNAPGSVGGGPGTVVDYFVGTGGAAGSNGGDSFFGATSLAASTVGAKGGVAATSATGGAGGLNTSGFPASGGVRNSGGAGGAGNASVLTGGGGGGAGGPGGTGGVGGAGDATAAGADFGGGGGSGAGLTTAGGAGGAGTTAAGAGGTNATGGGSGGAGGSGDGVSATAATGLWTSTHAPDGTTASVVGAATGGGGGGGGSATTGAGGSGANYGGGGGGRGVGTGGTSNGGQGLIIITYTAAAGPVFPPHLIRPKRVIWR